jgi:hypothetical protein
MGVVLIKTQKLATVFNASKASKAMNLEPEPKV